MKKIVLFGASGGLGSQLKPLLEKKYDVVGLSSKDVNILDIDELNQFFNNHNFDIVVNLSGYNYDSFLHKYNKDTLKNAQKVIAVNTQGCVNLLSSILPSMRQKQYGRIIFISSVLSENPLYGTGVYSASKNFIDGLVKAVSLENISKKITCNSIRLGYFDGGMTHEISDEYQTSIKSNIGLKRWGKIQELYQTIDYMIQTEYLTGQNIKICGGLK